MRLFIALELPPRLHQQIIDLISWLRLQPGLAAAGKWVENDNLHLTTNFLGEVSADQLSKLTIELGVIASSTPTIEIKIENPATIPAGRPHIMALQVKASEGFPILQRKINSVAQKLGLTPSAKAPHLTLARLKQTIVLPHKTPWTPIEFTAGQFSLVQSTLTPKGPIYKPLKAFKLASGAAQGKFRPSVAVCIINPKNEVLLIWRSENRPHDLGFPQGGINPGESVETAARRELKEELGLENITILTIKERFYSYRWPKGLIKYGKDINKHGYIGQEQGLVIARLKEVRPRLRPHPIEAAIIRWLPINELIKTLKPKRRVLGKLVMVELNKLGITNYE